MGEVLADDPKWIRAVGPIAIFVLGALALARAWPYGPDVQVDFGRELYVPWRVAEGDRLYADLAHFSGPLSVAWHALLFLLFGASLAVIKISNAIVAALIAALVYLLALRHADRWGAVAATLFFVGALAFGQLQPIGNYDYLTPYAHELTHGIALSLLALLVYLRGGTNAAWGCGVLLGLVFLTKIEVFTALGAALGLGLVLRGFLGNAPDPRRDWIRCALAFVATVAVAWGLLAVHAGPSHATAGLLDPWRNVFATDVANLTYYRWVMGTLDLPASLLAIGYGAILYAAIAAMIGLTAWATPKLASGWRLPAGLILIAILLAAGPMLPPAWATHAIRPLPLVLWGVFGFCLIRVFRTREARLADSLVLLAFAIVLPLKMLLNAKLAHYGFALYLPAMVAGVGLVFSVLPGGFDSRREVVLACRVWGVALLALLALDMNARTEVQLERRSAVVGKGGDAFLSDFRGDNVNQTLDFLAGLPAQTTLAALPEGIMLNYLARRVNPTRYVNFMPPEFSMYGGDAILDAFRENPPDVLLFVHKRTGLYGAPFFGRDYGRALHGWATANYDPVATFGEMPFDEGTRFGITVLERRGIEGR
ncbi:MAG: hypothetical protein GY733_09870 [bacterium]|nr:hypothetical protein [bacterium]